MRILVIGSGNIGFLIAKDLAKTMDEGEITVSDARENRAKWVASKIDDTHWIVLDVRDKVSLIEILSDYDLIIGALPGKFGYRTMEAAVEAGVDLVDVSYMAENPLRLDEAASKAGVSIIPDCGVAPGFSNMIIGHCSTKMNKVRDVKILVGGIPEFNVPPLGYTLTWSTEGLIDEYTRSAKIIKDGHRLEVPPLTGLEEIEFPEVGILEAFFTDGLRTLLHTFSNVENMWEKTLRYPGHTEKINLLKQLGFLDNKPVDVQDIKINPSALTAKLFESRLRMPEIGDILVMNIEVSGERKRGRVNLSYHVIDHYDYENQISAMARTTGYTASIVAQMIAKGSLKEKGVIPPEKIGMNERLFSMMIAGLREKGITIKEN